MNFEDTVIENSLTESYDLTKDPKIIISSILKWLEENVVKSTTTTNAILKFTKQRNDDQTKIFYQLTHTYSYMDNHREDINNAFDYAMGYLYFKKQYEENK